MYKRNSKILAALLTIVLVFSIFPSLRINAADIASGTCGPNLTWTLDSGGTLTISGAGFMDDFSPSQAPWKDYLTDIRYIYISPDIASIGDNAFEGCTNVLSINIPSSVSKIGGNAFIGCGMLSSINFPGTITDIGKGAFSYTGISDIPSGLDISEIPVCCFASCFNLKTVSIPSGVTKIDVMAFENCVNLKSITIPDSVTSIGDGAFEDCRSLTTVTMNSSLAQECKDNNVFEGCPSSLKINYSDINFTYNSSGNGTVTGYVPGSDPTTVYLTLTPDTGYVVNTVTVTDSTGTATINPDSSGNYSFPLPSGDATVDATFIKGGTFGAQGNNLTWTLDDAGTLTISGSGDMPALSSPWYNYSDDIKSVVVLNGVTSIATSSFDRITSLESVTIPNSVTSIGDLAFQYCTSLTSITIPDSVTTIGNSAFDYCTNLNSITIPDSVTFIGDNAFNTCTSLTSITIPDSVTSIGDYAFDFCTSLTDVTMSKVLYDDLVKKGTLGFVFAGIDSSVLRIHFSYTVDYKSNGNGTITGTTTKSFGTDQIELTIQPDNYYVLDKIEWSDGTNTVKLTATNGKYTMPDTEAVAVTLTATFKLDQKTVTFKNEDGTVLQSGLVDCGANPAYTGATPAKAEDDKYTYTFAGWSDGTKTYGPTDTLPAVTDDVTYTATFTETAKPTPQTTPATTPAPVAKPGTYYLNSMVEQDGNIIFTIKMSEDDTKTYDLLGSVSSDGVALTEGNQYTAAKGSAIITINKSFLDTLSAGTHKLTVTFTDGGSITIDYEVKAPAQAAPQAAAQAVQATGEAVNAASIAGACLILAAAGIAFTVTRKRKEEA